MENEDTAAASSAAITIPSDDHPGRTQTRIDSAASASQPPPPNVNFSHRACLRNLFASPPPTPPTTNVNSNDGGSTAPASDSALTQPLRQPTEVNSDNGRVVIAFKKCFLMLCGLFAATNSTTADSPQPQQPNVSSDDKVIAYLRELFTCSNQVILENLGDKKDQIFGPFETSIGNLKVKNEQDEKENKFIAWVSIAFLLVYCVGLAALFVLGKFDAQGTQNRVIDLLYFEVVTLLTTGYGDIVPDKITVRIVTAVFMLIGFLSFNILVNKLVSRVTDKVMEPRFLGFRSDNHRLVLAAVAWVSCILLGALGALIFEKGVSFGNGFYMAVTSVTTIGYGDVTFKRVSGRIFALLWLPISTIIFQPTFMFFFTEIFRKLQKCRLTKPPPPNRHLS